MGAGFQRLNAGHFDIGGHWPERGCDSTSADMVMPLGYCIGTTVEDDPVPPGNGVLNAWPFANPRMRRFNKIVCRVTFPYTATAIRFGIYTNKKASCYPDKLWWESAEITTGAGGIRSATFTAFRLPPGIYWMAWLANAEGGTSYLRGALDDWGMIPNFIGKTTIDMNMMSRGFCLDPVQTYGALPATYPSPPQYNGYKALKVWFKLT